MPARAAAAARGGLRAPRPATGGVARDAWIVFACALVARVGYVLYARRADPYFGWSMKGFDQQVFQDYAQEILKGNWLLKDRGLFYYSPLFAYYSAIIYKLFGNLNFLAVHLGEALTGAAACGLLTVVARTWLARGWALFAAGSYALAAPVLFYEQPLLIEGLVLEAYVLLLWGTRTAALALWARPGGEAPEGADSIQAWAAGFGFGKPWLRLGLAGMGGALAAVGRGNALAVLLAIGSWVLVALGSGWRGRGWGARLKGLHWRAGLALGCGALLVLGPLVTRNYAAAHKLTLGMTNGRVMFYLGNARDATGDFMYSDRFQTALAGAGKEPGIYMRMFFEDLRTDPGAILLTQLRKAYFFFGVNDYPDNVNFQMAQGFLWPLRYTPAQWEWLAPLGLVGLALAAGATLRGRRWGLLWVFAIVFSASIIAVIPMGRYRLPVVIAFALGAGAALEWALLQWRAERRGAVWAAGGAAALLCIALWPWPTQRIPNGRYIRQNDFVNGLSAAELAGMPAAGARILAQAEEYARHDDFIAEWLNTYLFATAAEKKDMAGMQQAIARMEAMRDSGHMPMSGALHLLGAYLQLGDVGKARPFLAQLREAMPDNPELAQLDAQLNGRAGQR